MIQLHGVSVAFGGNWILRDLTWTIREGQRIGLIGPNGAGKTTILRLVAGRLDPDDGIVAAAGSTTVGYLEQDVQEMDTSASIVDEAMEAFVDVLTLERREEEVHRQLELESDHESRYYQRLLEEQAQIHADLARLEAHLARPKTEAVLSGLGFESQDFARPIGSFSGGWRMRIALARLLLRRPDFLLLDEPTNHLDIDSIDWLEGYLKSYEGTVVIVSHDRYFIDRMVSTVAELSRGRITEYHGNYSFYLGERQKQRDIQQSSYENQQKQIADTERFIERFRYKASKASQVQSRVKMLERLDRIEPPAADEASITFRFPEPTRSGRTVLNLTQFSKSYATADGPLEVFDGAGPLSIERGDKIAIIGKNGAGKSTLARMIVGTEPFDGERRIGYLVETTFFAQHQAESLSRHHTILESLKEVATGQTETEIRGLLGAFLFSGDDVFKPVAVLSGGERSRVALARTLLRPANFLILDEPTNHLDIQSIRVLTEALRQYSGTFVIVSHDRHFLDQVINKVWRVGGGQVRTFFGNYSDYLWQVRRGSAREEPSDSTASAPQKSGAANAESRTGGPKTKEQKRLEAEDRNRRYRARQESADFDPNLLTADQLLKEFRRIEASILEHEEQQKSLEAELSTEEVYADASRVKAVTAAYEAVKRDLAVLYERWDQLSELLAN
jgi:ATP-binding cassette subfamily F protein 3